MTAKWSIISVSMSKIEPYIEEYKGHKFVRLNVNVLPAKNKFGKDVEITIAENQNRNNGEQKKEDDIEDTPTYNPQPEPKPISTRPLHSSFNDDDYFYEDDRIK